jgi:hypothetical protein
MIRIILTSMSVRHMQLSHTDIIELDHGVIIWTRLV